MNASDFLEWAKSILRDTATVALRVLPREDRERLVTIAAHAVEAATRPDRQSQKRADYYARQVKGVLSDVARASQQRLKSSSRRAFRGVVKALVTAAKHAVAGIEL